jgi:hypothetical protein
MDPRMQRITDHNRWLIETMSKDVIKTLRDLAAAVEEFFNLAPADTREPLSAEAAEVMARGNALQARLSSYEERVAAQRIIVDRYPAP